MHDKNDGQSQKDNRISIEAAHVTLMGYPMGTEHRPGVAGMCLSQPSHLLHRLG